MAFSELTPKLARPINGRIDLPPELALSLSQGGNDVVQRDFLAHNHYVNVARRGFPSGGNRAINKSQLHLAPQSGQCLVQDFRRTEGFANKPAQLVEHGTIAARLKIRLPPFGRARENTGGNKLLELSLCRPGAKANQADNLPLVESLIGVAEQKA